MTDVSYFKINTFESLNAKRLFNENILEFIFNKALSPLYKHVDF